MEFQSLLLKLLLVQKWPLGDQEMAKRLSNMVQVLDIPMLSLMLVLQEVLHIRFKNPQKGCIFLCTLIILVLILHVERIVGTDWENVAVREKVDFFIVENVRIIVWSSFIMDVVSNVLLEILA
jgi:hypothetical protein